MSAPLRVRGLGFVSGMLFLFEVGLWLSQLADDGQPPGGCPAVVLQN